MSEIEKMYENCGIYPDCRARECGLDYCANSSGCGYAVYPDFTAEKQIELIKWMEQYIMCSPFDEALAKFINSHWQDLTEEEKQQVKGILE